MSKVCSLAETVELMRSEDYVDRFKAEYYQLSIRYNKLQNMIDKWDNNKLSFEPTCPRSIYDIQLKAMKEYLAALTSRAIIEGVEL